MEKSIYSRKVLNDILCRTVGDVERQVMVFVGKVGANPMRLNLLSDAYYMSYADARQLLCLSIKSIRLEFK